MIFGERELITFEKMEKENPVKATLALLKKI
jgi:hypothetical protein